VQFLPPKLWGHRCSLIERETTTTRHSGDELEEQEGEALPDRKAMSTVSCDPSELGLVAIDELPQPPEPAEQ
jgi:hypothetical protein